MSKTLRWLRQMRTILVLLGFAAIVQAQEFAKVGTTGAQFLKIDMDARSVAMAGASMAFSWDAGAALRNPAGLVRIPGSSFIASYAPWFADINLYAASFARNFHQYGVAGIHFIYLSSGKMEETTVDQQQGTGRTFSTSDFALGLSYARHLTDKFSIGGNVRWIHEDLYVSKTSVFGVDLGFLYDTGYRTLRLGMGIKNFGSKFNLPDTYQDFDNGQALSDRSEYLPYDLPIEFAFGVSADPIKNLEHRVSVAVDAIHPSDNLERLLVGGEYAYHEMAFLRAGYIFRHDTAGLNAGAGILIPMSGYKLGVDYAFSNFTILDNVHRFTLRFQFGLPEVEVVQPPPPPPPRLAPPSPPAAPKPVIAVPDTAGQAAREENAKREMVERAQREAEDVAKASIKPIYMGYSQSELSVDGREAADFNADLLMKYPHWQVTIEGHCDERGSDEYNMALGERRATVVKDYLIGRGVAANRLTTVSYGETRPVDTGHTEEAWAKNRRVVLVIQ